MTSVSGSFSGVKDVVLKLKESVLSGGNYYTFKLTVTDGDGVSASNVYEIRTDRVPSTGMFFDKYNTQPNKPAQTLSAEKN